MFEVFRVFPNEISNRISSLISDWTKKKRKEKARLLQPYDEHTPAAKVKY